MNREVSDAVFWDDSGFGGSQTSWQSRKTESEIWNQI